MMTLTRGLWFAALDFHAALIAVKSTEVAANSSAVESDFSSIVESADELSCLGEVAVADGGERRMAVAGG